MKRWAIGSIAFFATLAFAIAFVALIFFTESKLNSVYPLNESLGETPIDADFELELRRGSDDWRDMDESSFPFKLMTTGEGFWAEEIEAKSGEKWLGLFSTGNGHELRYTRVKVTRAKNGFEDEEGEMAGKSVSVADSISPYFLLKDADFLKPGLVKTLLVAPDNHDYHENLQLSKGFDRTFDLDGSKYRMRVFGTVDSPVLVLESNGIRQAVYEVIGIGDATWELLWVGDLDGDGKLDFFADLPTFYNFSQRRLFLSSFAEQGDLLKQVALFHNTGC